MTDRSRRIDVDEARTSAVFGVRDANLRSIEQATGATVAARGGVVTLEGEPEAVAAAASLLEAVIGLVGEGQHLRTADLDVAARLVTDSKGASSLRQVIVEESIHPSERKRVLARSPAQQAYIKAIRSHEIVFGIGPAGTGKTYLAVALALEALRARAVRRIVLTRPAVEAGEHLGFLPGDLTEKVNPYLRPLHDAIRDMADSDLVAALIERGELEVAPLAFMRGRTLNDAFIILDEAQNTTHEQMKMFLTRMGLGSRMVVTGDVTQVDLPHGTVSGLGEAAVLLADIEGIAVLRFGEADVVRHRLVRDIVKAYDRQGGGSAGVNSRGSSRGRGQRAPGPALPSAALASTADLAPVAAHDPEPLPE